MVLLSSQRMALSHPVPTSTLPIDREEINLNKRRILKKNTHQSGETPGKVDAEHWHALSTDEVMDHLQVRDNGLTSSEAADRQAHYGYNQLTEAPRPSFLKLLLEQFNNFIVILLIVAALISALLGEWIDASAILAIVILNAILGIVQERRAE